MHPLLAMHKDDFVKAIDHLKKELSGFRTGRASAALVENIEVTAYNSQMSIKSLASIAVPDAKTITIDPWDKSVIKDIEKGIRDAGVGLNPVNEGTLLRISMPMLTEESRKNLIKLVREKMEETRETIRSARETCKDDIVTSEKDGDVTEDERYKLQDELDAMTTEFNDEVKKIGEEKEAEIMTI